MTDHLFRFRSVKSLLGEHEELERQEIYFAAPTELNDPMEGFKDIFWQGDQIVWKNLFRHYVLCLSHACSLYAVTAEAHPLTWDMIPIDDPYGAFDTDGIRKLQDTVLCSFFCHRLLNVYIKRLADRKHPVRQNELTMHIQNINALAVLTIQNAQYQCGLAPKPKNSFSFKRGIISTLINAIKMVDGINRLELSHPEKEFATEAVFASQRNLSGQLNLINLYNESIDVTQKNRVFVFVDFSKTYVREIERLVHPNWYAACFMQHCNNSSAWGHYGDGHKGVCLKFKVHVENNKKSIKLDRMNGWGSNGPMHGFVAHEFHPVTYQSKHVSVDFFRSLGSLSIPVISREWYHDRKGRRSSLFTDSGIDMTEEQRRNFWKSFVDAASTKLNDWKYEEEYRLLLHGHLLDFSSTDTRLAKYDFDDLDGIIFGIKTGTEDKLKIMKIFDKKCQGISRKDFNFYQAYYSPKTAKIEYAEMSLLKVS